MHLRLLFATVLTILSISALGQSLFDETPKMTKETPYKISGFIRSGFFLNKPGNKPQLSSGFADLAIKIKTENSSSFKAMADLRFRYGMEFSSESKNLRINEAYVMWYGLWAEIKAGQQIVKWSNSDFFRTQDRMNPRNNLYRTFDDNDRDLGNIMLKLNLRPLSVLDIELLYIPFARPSVLSTGIISIPDIVTIVDLPDLSVSENGGSLGLSSSVHLRNFDWGISWYKGYNPMPAICFESISLPQSDTDPPPSLIIESKLYEISMLASNIEFTAGKSIFRSELTYIGTGSGSNTSAFTSFSEIIFTFGMESSIGNLRFLLEYQGKYIVDFYPSIYEPGFPDSDSLPPGIPPEQLEIIVGEQIASFNRLYNYQLNEYNHTLAFRISTDNPMQIFQPELNMIFNLSTRDIMINPIVRIKPADNLSFLLGSDIFFGKDDSLYDMLNDQLSSIWMGIRINF